jgi:phage tail sheath gpL-like
MEEIMNETKNIGESFREFLNRLNNDTLNQNEARIILIGNKLFYGFLNVVFDFHITSKNEIKSKENQHGVGSILDEISKTDSKHQKTIKLDSMNRKKRTKFTQSAEGTPHFTRSNFIPTQMYRNHFMCSVLSDLLIDLFMPQQSKHYLKFCRGDL